jgi:hypothetical protein
MLHKSQIIVISSQLICGLACKVIIGPYVLPMHLQGASYLQFQQTSRLATVHVRYSVSHMRQYAGSAY